MSRATRPTVFIQANDRQLLGARISAHSFKSRSVSPGDFDVQILNIRDFPQLMQRGRSILRDGYIRRWDPDDLQSFTPLRFAPPTAMGFKGRAVVVDPDCFAVGDIAELFDRDMGDKAIFAVWQRPGNGKEARWATSVMLLDCAKLRHWDFDKSVRGLFAHEFDYVRWMRLELEDPETIGQLEPEWNDFDTLTPTTKILHTTKRRTQPWKAGLPIDFTIDESQRFKLATIFKRHYRRHPDPNQEAYIYSLLAEMLDLGEVTRAELVAEMAANHIRHDSLDLVERHRGFDLSSGQPDPGQRGAQATVTPFAADTPR